EVWPEKKQTLFVYRNMLPDAGQWIGFRFREEGKGVCPLGVRVKIHYGDQTATRQVVTGNSHRSQHGNTVHFGLGQIDRVDSAEIHWVNGQTETLTRPVAD